MQTVSMLIKPASGRCNLRCRYCFYEDVSEHRQEADLGLMSKETLELLVSQAMALAGQRVTFAFQGGEPMVRGLDFYRYFIELEQKYLRPGLLVEHSIQTNGTLIDEAWAEFFYENRFLVGVSLDGNQALHDANRVDAAGKGSWSAALRGLRLLQKRGVEYNILCVVTGAVGRRGQAVYQSLKKLGCRYLQFIPCLDPLGTARGGQPFSLTPERYSGFLRAVFDLWYRDWEQGDYVSIRLFDDYVHLLAGQRIGTCATNGECGRYFVVEGDGSIYPCDFFVLDRWRMGMLGQETLAQLADSPVAAEFCAHGRGMPQMCAGCQWLRLCRGGCQRDWEGDTRNYYCAALKEFFAYAYPRLARMAALERRMAAQS